MKGRIKEFPLTVEEVRRLMKKEEAKKYAWFAIGVSVVTILVALVLWIAKRRERDLEEHYEYFDDDFDELDENFDEFDDSIYDDSDDDEQIEYVKIKDFINDEAEENTEDKEEEAEAEKSADEAGTETSEEPEDK